MHRRLLPSKSKLFKYPPIRISTRLLSDVAADQLPCPTPTTNLRSLCASLIPFLLNPNSPFRNCSDLLTLSSFARSLNQIREIHGLGVAQGLLPYSVSLTAAFILNYATLGGSFGTCRVLYESTASFCKTTFLWNTLFRAYSILGVCDCFVVYNGGMSLGIRSDCHTFPSLLKTCAEFSSLQKGREIERSSDESYTKLRFKLRKKK